MAILLIEDDPAVQELVSTLLTAASFAVDVAPDGATGKRLANSSKYEVIILDLGLPDMDGIDLLRQMRNDGITTHVLILTNKDDPEDRVTGLDAGADDYLSKPCVLPELEARVRALLRRKYNAKNPVFTVGDLQINSATRAASRGGQPIPLTPREYALLEFLARKAGQLVTRAEIWENLYAMDSSTNSNVVDVYIGYLRKKLDVIGKPPLIHTRRGSGFILGPIT
jgi:two-component system copper resistance phosphate regulon response regulator CusR